MSKNYVQFNVAHFYINACGSKGYFESHERGYLYCYNAGPWLSIYRGKGVVLLLLALSFDGSVGCAALG